MSRRRLWIALACICGAAAGIGGWTFYGAAGALRESRARVAEESAVRFSSRPLARQIPTGLAFVGAPQVFSDARVFQGRLFIAGPAGLTEYDANGAARNRYAVGGELPPAPLVALDEGMAGDSRSPELWIATAGEGLLAFDGRAFRQIRAEDPRLRKLTAVLATGTGRILVGTEKSGVLVFDGRSLVPFHDSLREVPVTALAGTDADLWVGTLDRGVLHWKAGVVTPIDDALPDRQVLSLALDSTSLYAGTGLGTAEIRDDKVARVIGPGFFAQSLLATNGKLLIGTLEEGVIEAPLDAALDATLDARAGRSAPARSKQCGDCSIRKLLRFDSETYALAEDSLWRGSQEILRREESQLADRNIAALAAEANGRLWIGRRAVRGRSSVLRQSHRA
jgi:hypothetical protein